MRVPFLVLALAACLVLGPVADALAKSSGGSRGSFSSSGSRSSSSGWSSSTRPSAPSQPSGSTGSSGWSSSTTQRQATPSPSGQPQATQPAPSTSGTWSSSTGQSAAPGQTARPGQTSAFSSAGGDAVKRQAASGSYQDYQAKYSKTGNALNDTSGGRPILNPNRTFNSYKDYDAYRGNYYAGRGWSAPGYAFGSFSGFGMWDAMFLWFMMSHLSGPSFFYNHQADPGVQAFQKEAQRLSESNADLKKQLDEVNAKLDDLKKSGQPVDPKAVPQDVDPNIMLAKPPVVDSPKDSGHGLTWVLFGLAALAGVSYFAFFRRKSA